MATTISLAEKLLQKFSFQGYQSILNKIKPIERDLVDKKLKSPSYNYFSNESTELRHQYIKEKTGININSLKNDLIKNHEDLRGNVEQFIGMTSVPTGLVGPIQINGTAAQGEFHIPMATTEGALIASYNRGCRATLLSGGVTSVCLTERVQRAPIFRFENLVQLGLFIQHVLEQKENFSKIVNEQSSHAKLEDVLINIEGNQLILIFEYSTGDASGQNMVTFCTDALCKQIIKNSPVKILDWYIESNYSGDKKATSRSFSSVRGKKVTCECIVYKDIVESVLKSTPKAIADYWQSSTIATIQSGSIGAQGHIANGLTAIFLATGQDVACISEASIGITRMQITDQGDLYISTTLPSLIIGTIGGGTWLPTQRECLEIMQCYGQGQSRKFAEIIGGTILAGELSIAASIAAGDFSKAHFLFGRKSK